MYILRVISFFVENGTLEASQCIYDIMFLQFCLSLLECHLQIYNCQHAISIAERDNWDN